MHMTKVLLLLLVLQCCELCLTIKVPVIWDDGTDSDVKENEENKQANPNPKNVDKQIPVEYFEYNAPKPQFAVEVARFHGVQNPEQHFRTYPIKPHTNKEPLHLGVHHILDNDRKVYESYQQYVNKNDGSKSHVKPVSTEYEIFHPYKAEEPALQEIYRDPMLAKIRSDLDGSKNRLQNYEKEAGKPHITKSDYLESPEETERKLFPQPNLPARYEIHRPERRPIYYSAPVRYNHRDNILNQKFKHPLNQNYVKIKPIHYRPLQNHIQQLRQHHALKYDDEHNEYPQVQQAENNDELEEGYDIYEKGKAKYTEFRNNVDESINKATKESLPVRYKTLELQKDENKDNTNENDNEEFIPVKNYAQVRKTEVTKHLPRKAAFDDAETLEEIINAPRLREAVKSKKAQTVYTEEGYEDSAYDHAGEQKHASDHEGHGGYLKENVISDGIYKIPSVSSKHNDRSGSEHQDKILHGKKWNNNNKEHEELSEDEDYSDEEKEIYDDTKSYKDDTLDNSKYRDKRHGNSNTDSDPITQTENSSNSQHEVDKREVNFKVPEINFTATFLTEDEILKLAKQKIKPKKNFEIKEKYPYYFKNVKGIHKNSPLRYAENFKLIPKKSSGGTEFYDSRSKLECPEVENLDPIPEKHETGDNPTEDEATTEEMRQKTNKENIQVINKQPRLEGLGDKIDCFKTKYFGENPLDSPFFKEEIISNPEPIDVPKLALYKLKPQEQTQQESKIYKTFDDYKQFRDDKTDVFVLLDKFKLDQNKLHEPLIKKNGAITSSFYTSPATLANNTHQLNVYSDILENIKKNVQDEARKYEDGDILKSLLNSNETISNTTYNSYKNKDEVTKSPRTLRKKRATPFIYEPYKIIRDGQVQESKKTTTSGNVSPLIKQLQSSRVVDKVAKSNQENERQVKRNANTRTYIDIGRKDREKSESKVNSETTIVDVSVDPRRGEPRYEVRPANHKPEYTPVENKKSMSIEDYKAQTTTEKNGQITEIKDNESMIQKPIQNIQRNRLKNTTTRPFYDVSQFIPKQTEVQSAAASNTVKKTVPTLAPETDTKKLKETKVVASNEGFEEYEDEEITTTTAKPSFRRRIRITSTTEKPKEEQITESELPKLRLITRFRSTSTENPKINIETTEIPTINKYNEEFDITIPKYREKKKKSSTSTIVTDTKKYGDEEDDDDDDMRRHEVDALIGVTESLDDFLPSYEKEAKLRRNHNLSNEDDDDVSVSNDDDEDDDDEEDNDDDEEDEDDDDEIEEEDDEPDVVITTPQPTKRTLIRTTDAPAPTIPSSSTKLGNKPIVTKKKIEIHKETPVNKSSPHVSQFKQDIEEVEIIREIPSVSKKKSQKNTEALELYKDDNLAKDINKLSDVEIFSDSIDIDKGPKHGGNYRVATKEDIKQLSELNKAKDAIASQSENTKHVELDDYTPKKMHGGNLKSLSDISRTRQRGRSSKLIELSDPPIRGMHGGNLRYGNKGRRGGRKNEKLVELVGNHDDNQDDSTSSSREDNFKSFNSRNNRMHGGNYRSAKLVQSPETTDGTKKGTRKDSRKNAAELLNSFAQAVPILTTTPSYILDPSKRMYYYVDA